MPSNKGEIVINVGLDGVCAGESAIASRLNECQATRASAGTLTSWPVRRRAGTAQRAAMGAGRFKPGIGETTSSRSRRQNLRQRQVTDGC
jgi:hypothetical protein